MPRLNKLWSAVLGFIRNILPERLAPVTGTARAQWLEVFLIPLGLIGLAWVFSPEDPTLSKHVFPWLWFAPCLVALRYGVTAGLFSSLTVLANWVMADSLGRLAIDFSAEYFSGGVLLVLLCGEYSDVWRDRNLRMDEANLYATERVSRLTRRHLLLNLSHDRLEQEMLARPGSLRDALVRLRGIVIQDGQENREMPGALSLLHLLSQYIGIEAAGLYGLKAKGETRYVLGPLVAKIGEPEPLEDGDALLELALETRQLAHIASKEVSLDISSRQLVVAPLVAGNDHLVGVLAVTRIPFFSLNVENLQMMSVILAYYADNIRYAPEVKAIQQQLPTLPALFAEELIRMRLMQRKVGVSSLIVVMTFTGPYQDQIPSEFVRIKRGLDLYWQTFVQDQPVIAVLMPFATPSAREGFMQRIEGWLRSRFGGSFDSLGIYLRTIDFSKGDPVESLVAMIEEPAR